MFRLIRRVLFLLLIGVVIWQQWQIYNLRMSIQNTTTEVSKNDEKLADSLAKTQYYTKKAGELIKDGKFKEAQQSLEKAADSAKDATETSKGILEATSDFVGKTKEQITTVFENAQKKVSKHKENKKND